MRSVSRALLIAVQLVALALASSARAGDNAAADAPSVPRRRLPWMGETSCRDAFDAVVAPLIARCASYAGRLERADLIRQARDTLVARTLVPAAAFDGVTIRWCPLSGSGMVPEKDLVL